MALGHVQWNVHKLYFFLKNEDIFLDPVADLALALSFAVIEVFGT